MIKKTLSFFLIFCFLFLFCSCKNSEERPKNADKTINFNLSLEPQTLDPQISDDYSGAILIEALYEGLVRLDENNEPYPGVAEKWESNSDHTVFTFTLRQDAKWSNKEPVTANDFVYAFQRALSPETASNTCDALFCIKNGREIRSGTMPLESLGVTAQDDYTLVIELAYSYEEFPKLTATTPFMPCNQDFFEECSGKYGLETSYILGNGPFKIRNQYGWEHGKHIQLSRSSTYSGENSPLPSSLYFTIGDDEADVSNPLAALRDSTVDAIALPSESVEQAQKEGCSITTFEDTTWGLCFNTSPLYNGQTNPMSNLSIRCAFVQLLDREKLFSYIPDLCTVANDIITPQTTFLGESYRELAGTDLYKKADESSLNQVSSALSELSIEQMPSITVLCSENEKVKHMVNEMLIVWNQKFGNYFNMLPLPEDELISRVKNGEYQIALYPLQPSGDGPMQLLSLFKSDNPDNPAHLQDSTFDSLLSAAETANGMDALESYKAAESYLNDQCIFYPLYYESQAYACAKGVTGIVFHPYNSGIDFILAGKED